MSSSKNCRASTADDDLDCNRYFLEEFADLNTNYLEN